MANGILIAGLLLLLVGSGAVMRGGVGVARFFDVSLLWTGAVVIASLTVAPELFVSLRAATMGAPALALGGLIGTNIANLLFVMGLGALIHPMASPPKVVFRDGGTMLLASLGLIACALAGIVSRQAGILMILVLIGYVGVVFITDWRRTPDHSIPQARALYRSQGEIPSLIGSLFLFFTGLILLGLGAHFSVVGSLAFAREWGWDPTTVGLTILAAALSLPKLFGTFVAATREQTNVAVGQLLGAGVFGLLGVLGITAVVTPLAFHTTFAETDVYVLAGASVVLLPLLAMRWRLSRPRGVLLIAAYGCYLAYVLWRQGLPIPDHWPWG
jgi:cation:H+ antiporter